MCIEHLCTLATNIEVSVNVRVNIQTFGCAFDRVGGTSACFFSLSLSRVAQVFFLRLNANFHEMI